MTFYELSVITNTGYPYYNLKLKAPSNGANILLRFFDFTHKNSEEMSKLDPISSFELNAGLVSALFEFARNIDKKIEILEFRPGKKEHTNNEDWNYEGDVIITTQTEPYLLHRSVKEKIKLIYDTLIISKIPLDAALELLQNEVDTIIDILTDSEARNRIKAHEDEIDLLANNYLAEMSGYGLRSICITSFDLSPITIFGNKYSLNDVNAILRNIGMFPNIEPLEWIYRQSYILDEHIWVYIIKSGVGPTINGLFEPYFYLLFVDPQSYLGEFPGKLTLKFNQILG
ncbi:MAG: hypothetical protein ACXABG_01775 [Promethearchaeota archaeon]|jgi:hypothetical protein